MTRNAFGPRSLLWPSLVAMAFAFFYVITQPGPVDYNDAYDYDQIARSVRQGQFALSDDYVAPVTPTMKREPGYPVFRALVYTAVGMHPAVILWIQAILSGLAVFIAAGTIRRIDPRWALPAAWLTAVFPGLAVWAGQHYAETFALFLAAIAGYAWVRLWEVRDDGRSWRAALFFGAMVGCLALTKATFQALPVFAAATLLFTGPWRIRWKPAIISLFAFGIVVTPWIVRNALQFGQPAITYRTGVVLYTRALKAQEPWARLAASFGSVLVGEATILRFIPETPPIVVQLWDVTWADLHILLRQGLTFRQADAALQGRAIGMIFSQPSVLVRYVAWSVIDDLRLFGLSSPGSPKFGVELIANQPARDGTITMHRLILVWAAHFIQLMWWILIGWGAVTLIRHKRWDHPSLLFVGYAAILYAPFDNIPRYAVPILPWVIALIVAALRRPSRSGERIAARSTDRRLVEAANVAYHEAEAALYDQAHPEILWCERPHWEAFARTYVEKRRPAIRVLDMGAGTGFIGNVLRPFMRSEDTYVATDLSPEMLERLRHAAKDAPHRVETIIAPADRIPLPDRSIDVVVVNSALHHFPDVEATLREASRLLAPGGVLAVMHEPNIRFARSPLFRQVARVASFIAWKLDPPSAAGPKADYGPVFAHVNRKLKEAGFIPDDLSPSDIQALVDVHSPTARGRVERFGFDPFAWIEDGPFAGWAVESIKTYNFLGKVDPSARMWRRVVEHFLGTLFPRSGYQFSLVLRKPMV